jgi:PAS domain S-box-containing protein
MLKEQLFKSIKYLQNIIDSSMDMIIATDSLGNITEFNLAARVRFNYSIDEIIGRQITYIFAPIELSIDVFDETIKRGKFTTEAINICKDGATFISEISFSSMISDNNDFIGIMGIIRDITNQKALEQKQKELFQQFSVRKNTEL